MPDYGWAYINLDVLKTITGPTGSILIKSSSTELSGSKFLAYATASNKVGIGLNFPTVLPSYQLDVSASSGQLVAARYTGDVVISGSALITGSLTVATLHADTVISSSNLIVRDEVIGLGFGSGSGQTGSVGDRGFVFGLDGDLNQAFLWDQTSGSFILGKIGAAGPEGTTFDIPEANLSKLKVGEVTGSKGRFDFTNGNVVITGSYYGDGSNLQNLPGGSSLSGTTAQLTTGVETSGYLRVSGSSTLNAVTATTISASSTLHIVDVVTLGSNLQVTGAISGSNALQAVGPTTLGSDLTVSGSSTLKELFSTEISASGGMQIVNETILGGDLTVSGTVSVDNNISGSGTLQAVGDSVFGGKLNVSSSATFASSISGSSTLQVVGDSVFGGKLNVSSSATFASTISGSSALQAVGNTTLGGLLSVSGSLTGSNVLYVEASSNRVGINRPTPEAMLHMSQSSAYPTSMLKPVIRIDHVGDADSGGGGGPTTTPILILTGTAPAGEDFFEGQLSINKSSPAGALHVTSKGTDTLVANQGKVAIGHSGPGSVLDVRGESQLYRVVNTKNDYENIIMFATGAGDGVGHFGSFETGSSFHVSGTSYLTAVTASVGFSGSIGNFATLNINSVAVEGGTVDGATIGGTTPGVVNQTAGTVKYRSKAAGDSPYSVVASDYIIGVDTSGGAVQINLQAAATAGAGRMLIIKDTKGTAGTNNITIEPNGSEKIDRQLNMIIAANSGSVILFCDGTEYFIAGTR